MSVCDEKDINHLLNNVPKLMLLFRLILKYGNGAVVGRNYTVMNS